MVYLLFVLGFLLLVKGAKLLVGGATSIAKKFRVSDLAIGLTVVAFGTTVPELIVSLLSTFEGKPGIATGNIFGSVITNLLLILGTAATVKPLLFRQKTVYIEIPFLIIAILVIAYMANFTGNHFSTAQRQLSKTDGYILLCLFCFFLVYIFYSAREKELPGANNIILTTGLKPAILYIISGVILLYLGGKWVVDGAVELAKLFGFTENFIGLTIVAAGTSLPEFATSVMAVKKGKTDVAVGNIIGANILNLLWVFGLTASLGDIPFNSRNNFEIGVIFTSAVLLLVFMANGQKTMNRGHGSIFLLAYICYIAYLLYRE